MPCCCGGGGCPDCGGLFVVTHKCGFFDGFAFYDDITWVIDQSGCADCEPHVYCDVSVLVAEHIIGCPPNIIGDTYETQNLRICGIETCDGDPAPCGVLVPTFHNEVTTAVIIERALAGIEALGGCPDGCIATYVLNESGTTCTAFCDGPGCPTGACCHGSLGTTCDVVTHTACGYLGGGYMGDGAPCSPSPC